MRTAAAAVLCLVLGISDALAAPLRDFSGREVPIGKGHPALVFFGNRRTRDVLLAKTFDFTYSVRDAQPVVVIRIDLSDVPGFMQPLVKNRIAADYRNALDRMRAIYRQHGQAPPAALEEHVFFVVDPKGEGRRALGLPKGFSPAFVQVLDARGHLLGTMPFPAQDDDARALLERSR